VIVDGVKKKKTRLVSLFLYFLYLLLVSAWSFISSYVMTLFISILGQPKVAGGPYLRLCLYLGRQLF